MRPTIALIPLFATLLLGAVPVEVVPTEDAVAAPPDQYLTTVALQFAPSTIVLQEGAQLIYVNADPVAPHDVTAVARGDDGRPLFASETVAAGGESEVEGTSELPIGMYEFLCTIHPTTMSGTLEVVERVTPDVPLPVGDVPAPTVGAVATPTAIAVAGDTLYAASWSVGTVEALPILEGGVLGPAETYASGFSSPLGIAFDDDGWLYVADSHASERSDRATAGRVWAIPPGGGDAGEIGEIVVDELPNGRHNTNHLEIHDGRLYITNGNSTDDGVNGGDPEAPLSGTLLSVRLGARDLRPADAVFGAVPEPEGGEEPDVPDLLVEATGMRNNFGVAFRPGTGDAWMTINGPDEQDPYGEDTLVAVREVSDVNDDPVHFGFPECLYADTPDGWAVADNEVLDVPCGEHAPPEQLLGLHVAATGLAFSPEGDIVLGRFGNFFGDTPRGRDLVRVPIGADGSAGEPEPIAVLPAPLDVAYDGARLYVADFALGQILLLGEI